jgi:hypothetical protein
MHRRSPFIIEKYMCLALHAGAAGAASDGAEERGGILEEGVRHGGVAARVDPRLIALGFCA